MARTPAQIQETVDGIIWRLTVAAQLDAQARDLKRRAQERCERDIYNGLFLHSDGRRLLEVDEGRGTVRELTSLESFAEERSDGGVLSGQISPAQAERLMRQCANVGGAESFEYDAERAVVTINGRTCYVAYEAEAYLAALSHIGPEA